MKMARAFEYASAPLGDTPESEEGALPLKNKIVRETSLHNSSSSEDDGKGGRRKKKGKGKKARSALHLLAIPPSYNPILFGTVGGAAGPQFGGNGMAPFGEQWERSKARKPAPHLNGRNWMYEFSKVVGETNRAIRGVAREYSAYHKISLGAILDRDVEEEQQGVWELSGDEEEYETLEQFNRREGLGSEDETDFDEIDDRRRGRTPSPAKETPLGVVSDEYVKDEEVDGHDAMHLDSCTDSMESGLNKRIAKMPPAKRHRRRRSPLRGFYEPHTGMPYIRKDGQSKKVIHYEKIDMYPALDVRVNESDVLKDKEMSLLRRKVRDAAAGEGVSQIICVNYICLHKSLMIDWKRRIRCAMQMTA